MRCRGVELGGQLLEEKVLRLLWCVYIICCREQDFAFLRGGWFFEMGSARREGRGAAVDRVFSDCLEDVQFRFLR